MVEDVVIKMYRCSHFSAGNNTAPLRFPVVLLFHVFMIYVCKLSEKCSNVLVLVLRVNII